MMLNNKIMPEDKIFLSPGDVVTIKQDIDYKPKMVVQKIERNIIKNQGKELLRGVKTRWFTKDGLLQEALFSTKDLVLIK